MHDRHDVVTGILSCEPEKFKPAAKEFAIQEDRCYPYGEKELDKEPLDADGIDVDAIMAPL